MAAAPGMGVRGVLITVTAAVVIGVAYGYFSAVYHLSGGISVGAGAGAASSDRQAKSPAVHALQPDSQYDRYGVVFDAGSTGTRVHVYKFQPKAGTKPAVTTSETLGVDAYGLVGELFEENQIGLSSLAQAPAGVSAMLQPLLLKAEAYVPPAHRKATKVSLRATAGLRLLGDAQVNALIAEVEKALRASAFTFASAGVISGTEEGVWAWLTVNYLIGTLGPDAGHQHGFDGTAAVMDLGGASTQVVFEPAPAALNAFLNPTGPKAQEQAAARKQLFHTLHFGGRSYTLFEKSYLRYGLMEARRRARGAAVRDSRAGARDGVIAPGTDVPHPCLPRGFEERTPPFVFHSTTDGDGGDGKPYALVGALRPGGGSAASDATINAPVTVSCGEWVRERLFKTGSCPAALSHAPHCSFDEHFQPPLDVTDPYGVSKAPKGTPDPAEWFDHVRRPIFAFSYFFDRAVSLGLVQPTNAKVADVTIGALRERTERVCGSAAPDALHYDPLYATTVLAANPQLCFDAAYVTGLLVRGYGLSENVVVTMAKQIDSVETGWCLGSVLNDLFGRA